jgi:hypothetical protein
MQSTLRLNRPELNFRSERIDSDVEMHAALDVNIPNYASAIVTTNEIVDSISSL